MPNEQERIAELAPEVHSVHIEKGQGQNLSGVIIFTDGSLKVFAAHREGGYWKIDTRQA